MAVKERTPKELTLSLLERILPEERTVAVRLWDGSVLPATVQPARATLVLAQSDTLGRMLTPPIDLSAGEAFIRGDFDIEGDIEAAFEILTTLDLRFSPLDWLRLARDAAALGKHGRAGPLALAARLRGRDKERDRLAIAYHYDVSNRFYELWLDRRMVYSCAYFPTGGETLDEAQEAKLELICRKLRLKPGERLLDIGCGWGGLVVYAAERYGVSALGVTVSQKQHEEASARVAAAGLEDKVSIKLRDYRELDGEFDKIASVGMAEHVGGDHLPTYFKVVWRCLRPGGLMLNHAISAGPAPPQGSGKAMSGEFAKRYVFPNGEILPLWRTLKDAEEAGFEARDVEDLREHYRATLRCWTKNLERRWDEAVGEVGLELARLRKLFLNVAAFQFAAGHVAIHQALLAKPDAYGRVELPPSRADLYR
jgi:cyclopropane-fatty-acyl-phospholipid synthase